jgi:hypothetical protein
VPLISRPAQPTRHHAHQTHLIFIFHRVLIFNSLQFQLTALALHICGVVEALLMHSGIGYLHITHLLLNVEGLGVMACALGACSLPIKVTVGLSIFINTGANILFVQVTVGLSIFINTSTSTLPVQVVMGLSIFIGTSANILPVQVVMGLSIFIGTSVNILLVLVAQRLPILIHLRAPSLPVVIALALLVPTLVSFTNP